MAMTIVACGSLRRGDWELTLDGLRCEEGITALVGPNGTGKTSVLRLLAGLEALDAGSLTIGGELVDDVDGGVHRPAHQRSVALVFQDHRLFGHLRAVDDVAFPLRRRGIDRRVARRRAHELLERVDMDGRSDARPAELSGGQRQRVALARALAVEPDVLLLDEPLNGTDPRQRIQFQRLLRQLADEGRTILISSHILEEVEVMADTVLLLVAGKLAASGDYHAIRAKLDERPYHVRVVSSDPRTLAAELVRLEAVDSVRFDPDGALIVLSRNVAVLQRALPSICQELQVRLRRVEPLDDTLESVFGYLVEA